MPLMPKWKGEMRFRETKRKNAKCEMMIFTTILSQKLPFLLTFLRRKVTKVATQKEGMTSI